MSQPSLRNPLAVSTVMVNLVQELRGLGFDHRYSTDVEELDRVKRQFRGTPVTALFDGKVCHLPRERFFWTSIFHPHGGLAGIQAFRLDTIYPHLAEWASQAIIGIYMRRQEMLVPTFNDPPPGSISEKLRGDLCYHGELWVDPQVRNRRVLDAFTRSGLLMAALAWHPEAIWALTSKTMASHGHPLRMGYCQVETGFLRWTWAPEDNPLLECLIVSELQAVEQWAEDMLRDAEHSDRPRGANSKQA